MLKTPCPECSSPALLRQISLVPANAPAFAQAATQPAEYAVFQRPVRALTQVEWVDVVRNKVKPLTHPRGKRWPLIMWESAPFAVQKPEVYKDFLDRGDRSAHPDGRGR